MNFSLNINIDYKVNIFNINTQWAGTIKRGSLGFDKQIIFLMYFIWHR